MTLQEIKVVTEDPADQPDQADKPEEDGRTSRPRPDQRRSSPRGTDEPRATGKNISARVRAQVTKQFRDGLPLKVDLGYRRQLITALSRAGMAYPESAALGFFASMGALVDNLTDLGTEGYEGPNHFMEIFDRLLDAQLGQTLDAE